VTLNLPSWFKQRQAKAEELAIATYRVTGPNLTEAVVEARLAENLRWQAVLREKGDGPEIAASPAEFAVPGEALAAAFELYRQQFVV
jgi:hypothetical protein